MTLPSGVGGNDGAADNRPGGVVGADMGAGGIGGAMSSGGAGGAGPDGGAVDGGRDTISTQSDVARPPDGPVSMGPCEGRPCLANVVQVAAGSYHTCAVRAGGFVQCWGKNEDGQLGNGSTIGTAAPASVPHIGSAALAASLGAGFAHTCATFTSGHMQCWGVGALGNYDRRPSPVDAPGITEAIAVAAGRYQTCVLLRDGSVSCWLEILMPPVRPSGLPSATAVVLAHGEGAGGCALATGGAVWCWKGTAAPSALAGLRATSISAGGNHFCAVAMDRSVWCWGGNRLGQLGDGKTSDTESAPIRVAGISEATAVSTGFSFSCALISDGSVRCWGDNTVEQLGIGTTTPTFTRVPVIDVSGAKAISSGGGHTCALISDGGVRCWGENGHGQLGNGFPGGAMKAGPVIAD